MDVEKVVFAPPNPTNKQTKNWSAGQQQQQVRVHSNELTRGTTELVELVDSALSLIGEIYIGARALLTIWFGYIACLSQLGGGGVFYSFK